MKQPQLADTIINMRDADLQLRTKLLEQGVLDEGYHPEMEAMHIRHAKTLNKIIDEIGYPDRAKVGAEASEAAWIIIQHSISLPSFMRKCHAALTTAVQEGRVEAVYLAYLTDRIAVLEGKPQLYGTQYDWDADGQLSPQAYDSMDAVDRRRADLGLPNMQEQTEIHRRRALAEGSAPPSDPEAKKEAYQAWRRSVGWV